MGSRRTALAWVVALGALATMSHGGLARSNLEAGVTAAQQGSASGAQSTTYTEAQATRGKPLYDDICQSCHLTQNLLTGETFALTWNGRTAYELYDLIANTMPQDDPGRLTTAENVSIVAYLMKLNGMPAGKDSLPSDKAGMQRVKFNIKPSAWSSP